MKKVLIVGRPNVGKSSLFNKLIRKRRALVMNSPGVTRDVLKGVADWWGQTFEVWDCGGFTTHSLDPISINIKSNITKSLKQVDLVILIMDGRLGLHEDDKVILKMIKNKKHLLVVNKVDQEKKQSAIVNEFYELGSDFIKTAFEKDVNIDQVVSWILENNNHSKQAQVEKSFSIMLTGQVNVGKSSLFNKIISKERSQTSSQPHTTVDVVDDVFLIEGARYQIWDGAGIGKKSKNSLDLQRLAVAKTMGYLEDSNLVLLVVDATKTLSKQDIRILSYCLEQYKPVILILNKWDLVKNTISKTDMRKKIKETLNFHSDIFVHFTSATTGVGVKQLSKKIKEMKASSQIQISTSKLNQFLSRVVQQAPQPVYGTKNIRFYYLTQVKSNPPSFLVFTNEPKGVSKSYKKFLEKKIQQQWSLKGIPIQILFKKKTSKQKYQWK